MKRVLILAGGGVRGAMQLDTLLFFEKYYGRPIYKIYDLIVGTSVGAITGGILATGLLDMPTYKSEFLKHISLIFKKPWWRFGLFRPLYDVENIKEMWNNFFTNNDISLKDLKTKFVCTAVDLCDDQTYVFRSWDEKIKEDSLFETIAKSFAAPYYFGQFQDEKNKKVWTDGGIGVSNAPLDWAFTETIELGWQYEPREFTLLGTGIFNRTIPFNKINSRSDRRKIIRYMDPFKGGFARVQSTLNQIRRMRVIAKADPDIDLNVYQLHIPRKYEPLDKIQYLNQYLYYGKIMASQVATHVQAKEEDNINEILDDSQEEDQTKSYSKTPDILTKTRIILYLDLFSSELKKLLLIRGIIEYHRQIKKRYPNIALHLFFYTKTNDPFLSEEIHSSSELVQVINEFCNLRDPNYSNLENGLIYCLSYFATNSQNPLEVYKLIILSDLPSLWGEEITNIVFQIAEQISHVNFSIDVIRFGEKSNFPDNPKLEELTHRTGGRLEYKRDLLGLLRPNPLAFLLELIR